MADSSVDFEKCSSFIIFTFHLVLPIFFQTIKMMHQSQKKSLSEKEQTSIVTKVSVFCEWIHNFYQEAIMYKY